MLLSNPRKIHASQDKYAQIPYNAISFMYGNSNIMADLYGIAHCSTVKKARAWLAEREIDYTFHDFKKHAPTAELLNQWLQQVTVDTLINKRGTTWRKLTSEQQAQADDVAQAVALMCEHASVIKRPVLVHAGGVYVGFVAEEYAKLFD